MNIIDWQLKEKEELLQIKKNLGINIRDISLNNKLEANELKLQNYSGEIRREWLQKVCLISSKYCVSPWRGMQPRDMDGNDVKYTYGTLIDDSMVAKKLMGYSVKNYEACTYLYNNGMAAIRGTLEIINSFIKAPLDIQCKVGYFETRIYLETLTNRGISINKHSDNANVFLFEPIQYYFNFPITDVDSVIDSINKSKAKEKFVLVDSTMDCSTSILNYIQDRLINKYNVVFIDIRSGIKQDQLGLELTSLGVATWHVSSRNKLFSEILFNYIQKYKDISGENISYEKLLLMSKFSFNDSVKYKTELQQMVKSFLDIIYIENSKYISSVLSPESIYGNTKSTIPFVFIKFNLKKRESYEQLLNNIVNCCQEFGCFLPYRNSFGFRYPSIEFICDYKTKELVMKFGLGVYKGVLFSTIVEIINALGCKKSTKLRDKIIKGIEEWT